MPLTTSHNQYFAIILYIRTRFIVAYLKNHLSLYLDIPCRESDKEVILAMYKIPVLLLLGPNPQIIHKHLQKNMCTLICLEVDFGKCFEQLGRLTRCLRIRHVKLNHFRRRDCSSVCQSCGTNDAFRARCGSRVCYAHSEIAQFKRRVCESMAK